MGDRTYTRFTIPLSAIVNLQHRRILAPILETTVEQLNQILSQDPASNDPIAGHANETAVRMVNGVPCLVFEDDEVNYGGSQIEDDLVEAGFPFLRFNLAGGNYGPGRSAYTGTGDLHVIDCDANGNPIICVTVENVKPVVDPDALAIIEDFLAAQRAVLHPSDGMDKSLSKRS